MKILLIFGLLIEVLTLQRSDLSGYAKANPTTKHYSHPSYMAIMPGFGFNMPILGVFCRIYRKNTGQDDACYYTVR